LSHLWDNPSSSIFVPSLGQLFSFRLFPSAAFLPPLYIFSLGFYIVPFGGILAAVIFQISAL
jgi:hypothetical protein